RLRTLRACRLSVEREFRRFEGMSAGRAVETAEPKGPEQFAAERLKKARAALKKAAKAAPAHLQPAIETALRMLEDVPPEPREVSQRISRTDDALALLSLRALPFPERVALNREARLGAGPRPAGATLRARKDALRAHRVAAARVHANLPSLS
ncbi:MAG: hypothetical protein ACK4N5_09515, partial [Myxococcales bacterium]